MHRQAGEYGYARPVCTLRHARGAGRRTPRRGFQLHKKHFVPQQQGEASCGYGTKAVQRLWRRGARHIGGACNTARRGKENSQCYTGRGVQQERYGGRYPRVPREPPHRACTQAMHHPLQRGKNAYEIPARRYCAQGTPLAHTARALHLQGAHPAMWRVWAQGVLQRVSKRLREGIFIFAIYRFIYKFVFTMSNEINIENWKQTDINVDSLWIIPERAKGGKHKNIYHGNFVPQIPNQLIRRYTNIGDTVLELFSGSGTTLFECENLKRDYIGFDINEKIIKYVNDTMGDSPAIDYEIKNADVTDSNDFATNIENWLAKRNKSQVDFMIAHPPYLDIVKFTDDERDLSNISNIDLFIEKVTDAICNGFQYLKKNSYFAVVAGDVYKKSEVIPLAFLIMNSIRQKLKVKMKGIIIKNIEGNRGKLGTQDIWKYRALKSDYFLFKHEYIFVFKKI